MQPDLAPMAALVFRDDPGDWWDDTLTQLLLRAIGSDCEHLVDLRCGLARAAHSLLPSLPNTRYTGIEVDGELLSKASEALATSRFRQRATLLTGNGLQIPLPDESADVVLSVMGLQHCPDVPNLLAEARRVLRPGATLVAVEPDNLAQQFYFDGTMEPVTAAIRKLCVRVDETRQPADAAIGPRLPALFQTAGFDQITTRPHMVGSCRRESAKHFANRLRRIAERTACAAGLGPESGESQACERAIRTWISATLPKRLGFSMHLVPSFVCSGRMPAGRQQR